MIAFILLLILIPPPSLSQEFLHEISLWCCFLPLISSHLSGLEMNKGLAVMLSRHNPKFEHWSRQFILK